MATGNAPRHATTPPKGRPTRSQHRYAQSNRLFGSTAQWIGVALLLLLVFVIIVITTDAASTLNPLG